MRDRLPPMTTEGHKSCWDCEHIRVSKMPMRKCILHPVFIWFGDGDDEAENHNGSTQADTCPDYQLCSERITLDDDN